MYKVELDIDDEIYEKFIGALDLIPKDKLLLSSSKYLENETVGITLSESEIYEQKINKMLSDAHLSHFQYYNDTSRILYTRDSGDSRHVEGFQRLTALLKEQQISYTAIGIDVVILERD